LSDWSSGSDVTTTTSSRLSGSKKRHRDQLFPRPLRSFPSYPSSPPTLPARPAPPALPRVVKDDPQTHSPARDQPADPAPHDDATGAARPVHRPFARGEHDTRAALDRHRVPPRLRPRPLFDEQQLAA